MRSSLPKSECWAASFARSAHRLRRFFLPRRRPKRSHGDDGKTERDEALLPAGQFVPRRKEKRPRRIGRRNQNHRKRPNPKSHGQPSTEALLPSAGHNGNYNTIGWCWQRRRQLDRERLQSSRERILAMPLANACTGRSLHGTDVSKVGDLAPAGPARRAATGTCRHGRGRHEDLPLDQRAGHGFGPAGGAVRRLDPGGRFCRRRRRRPDRPLDPAATAPADSAGRRRTWRCC